MKARLNTLFHSTVVIALTAWVIYMIVTGLHA